MKRNLAKIVLVTSLCGCLLAGCTGQVNTKEEPTVSSSPTAEPVVTITPSPAALNGEPTPSPNSTSEEENDMPTAVPSEDTVAERNGDFICYESLEDFPYMKLSVDEGGNTLCKDGIGWWAAPGSADITGEIVSDGQIIGTKIRYSSGTEWTTWLFFDSSDLSMLVFEQDITGKDIVNIDHRTLYFEGNIEITFE